ncbi:MAG: hypothetical protein ACI3VQ_08855 [Faecousia sp.]
MTVAEMIAQRTAALRKVLNDCAVAVDAKGGTPADDLDGLQDAIASIPAGVKLPELTTPAAVGHVLAEKEYIDAAGDKKTGTLVVCDTIEDVEHFGAAGTGVYLDLESTADGSSMTMTLPEPNLLAENIVNGASIFGVLGSAKKLRVETGTITPAEDVTSLAIPCSDGAKAFVLVADSTVIGAVEGQASKRYVTTAVANFAGSIDGAPNTAMQIWNLSSYANAGRVSQNTDGVALSSSYYFYAGTYSWAAYYWEDT